MLANGHTDAQFYPLCRVWEEAAIVVERENSRIKTDAILTNQAVSTAIATAFGNNRAQKNFQKLLDEMSDADG
ncbi:hypothetical protein AEAC466_04265 [Asticcacaulis sp. AC466]|uniref:hypothetical protein n=1 Tax=Asticcacaulis sp. AC466 TaxID=1282362 RepID=UPI0003C3B696|nr:hypothetical protein [Asticcacaulis sp. AC466]ESQ85388.1 hypothetical protein AEAC466_04265 [Asticcacaulis sp. AC466]